MAPTERLQLVLPACLSQGSQGRAAIGVDERVTAADDAGKLLKAAGEAVIFVGERGSVGFCRAAKPWVSYGYLTRHVTAR